MSPRRRPISLLVLVLLVLTAAPRPVSAHREDGGGWFMLFGTGTFEPLDPALARIRWWFDGQVRARDDSNGYDQTLVRPALGYTLGRGFSLWQGYLFVDEDPRGRDNFNEHRSWQQLLWQGALSRFSLQSRTRLEQRWVDGDGEAGWRFREFVKASVPLSSGKRFGLAAYDEVFFELNDTSAGQDTGFRQNRFFVGPYLRLDAGGMATVELGYLNQIVRRDDARDLMNHIASLNLMFRFP